MRRRAGAVSLLLASGILVVAMAVPAQAKGPQRVIITGPGLGEPIVLDGADVGTLFGRSGADSGIWSCLEQAGCVSHRPHGELGPRFVATYVMLFPNASGREVRSRVVQYLYPQAQPKPVSYVPAGQPYSGRRTVGGTVALSPTLLENVTGVDLGAAPAPVASPAAAPAATASADDRIDPTLVMGISALVAFIVIVALAWRRRRGPATSHVAG
jgi:hypothetical protein